MNKNSFAKIGVLFMVVMLFVACPNGVDQGGSGSAGGGPEGGGPGFGGLNYDITLKAVTISETSISFEWSEIVDLNSYALLVTDKRDSNIFDVTYNGAALKYTTEGLLPGKTYYFHVTDFTPKDGVIKHRSRTLEVKTANPTLPQVQGFKAEATSSEIFLTWNAMEGITTFIVEDLNSNEPVKRYYKVVDTVNSFNFSGQFGPVPGQVYNFRVMALSSDEKHGGQFSEPVTISLKPAAGQ